MEKSIQNWRRYSRSGHGTICHILAVFSEYYCHRDSSDSCRRDFNLVSLICRLWNALSTSGGSVHVCRFSTIFAIDWVWFGSKSMYSSWKRQLLLCESYFAEALEVPLKSFLCPDQLSRLRTTLTGVNMCPLAESSFWYQAFELFLSHIIRRKMFANLTVNKLSYSAIAKQKITCVIGKNVLKVLHFDISVCALHWSHHMHSILFWFE